MSSIQRTGLLLLVVFAVIVGGAWQAADKPVPVQKWEYKEVLVIGRAPDQTFEKLAGDLGEQGWELVTTYRVLHDKPYLYFKRPKQ